MKLLLYKLKLASYLVIFLLKTFANFSNKTKPVIIGIFIIGLLTLISGIALINSNQKPILITNASPAPKNSQYFFKEDLSEEEIKSKISYWEKILEAQPTSRDVLLNLSNLYSSIGDSQKAESYNLQAKQIDPNNPIFE